MTEQRKEELLSLWWKETNEDETQEWRDELTADEQGSTICSKLIKSS